MLSIFILLSLAVIGVSAQAQPRPRNRATDRQVSSILQRLERSSNKFRGSLNMALMNGRIDETRPQNDINSFAPAFESAIDQFRTRFTRHQTGTADVQNILQKASLVNGFMTRNRLNTPVQNDWSAVRTDLNSLASAYGISSQWSLQQPLPPVDSSRASRLSDGQLNQLIQRIETGGDRFQSSLADAFGRSRYDQTRSDDNMNNSLREFKNATAQLRNQFDAQQPVSDYVQQVLTRATPIDTFMHNNQLTNRAQSDWSTLHGDLNTLAGAFNLSANLQNGGDQQPRYNSNSLLTGTFRLDASRSDKPRDVADRAARAVPSNQRQAVYDRMIARLESPQMLAIERNNSTVTMASSLAQRSTFEADGVERQEQLNGRTSRVTAILRGDQLAVNSTGYRENDFNVTFEPIENGRRLRVTREVFSERLNQPVLVNSLYDRTSDVAQWNVYNGSGPVLGNSGANNGEFIIGDGETVVAVLNNDLTTKQAKQGDRFSLTVREPGQYEGAVIEGTVGSVTNGGSLTGRSGMTLDFDTIRLRNGQTYRFGGALSSVRTLNGETVKVDNEGSARGGNQTTQTITRAGIGTAVGAIIGAIAGGGKGAAIGGIIGAVGGAGSVYITGKDNLELPTGTELTIRAGAPR
jgi:hypothetical protein